MPREEQGVTSDRFSVIPRTLIFVTRGSQVLLLKGAPHKRLWANRYNGIGGHVERGEGIESSARRELLEETGLRVVDLWLCAVAMIDAGASTGICNFIFRADYQAGALCRGGEGGLERVEQSRIAEYPLVEDLYLILPRLLDRKRGDPLLSFRYWYDAENHLQVEPG